MNVYFGNYGQGSGASGVSIIATEEEFDPFDNIFMDITSVPIPELIDQEDEARTLGLTIVHEVGHWL